MPNAPTTLAPAPVLTRAYDTCRSGANLQETKLTRAFVRQHGVRVLARLPLPGDARGTEGQPLVVPGLTMPDGLVHNVIFIATMANDVYAFDFDTYDLLWMRRIAHPIPNTRAYDMYLINDHWGILGTPVIDADAGVIWVVAMQSPTGSFTNSTHRLLGLELTTGATVGSTLLSAATYQPPDGLALQKMGAVPRKQRCGLALDVRQDGSTLRKTLFVANGSFIESAETNQGWLTAVDVTNPVAPTLEASITTTARGQGGGIWMGGQAPIIHPDEGYIGITVGNGDFDGNTDFGESVVKYVYHPPSSGQPAKFEVQGNFTPYTDTGRVYGAKAQTQPRLSALDKSPDKPKPSNMDSASDEDLNSGGPLLITKAMSGLPMDLIIVCGKDGIGYVFDAETWPSMQPSDFAPATIAAKVYARALWIGWLTYYNPGASPTPTDLSTIPTTYADRTHHLHGTCLFYKSSKNGPTLFCWGENGNLRVWRINADGSLSYLACSAEMASPQAPVPPGGMPGGMMTLAANGAMPGTALIYASVPYGDANKTITNGRFLIYDAENFAAFDDGSGWIQPIWDSQNWGIAYLHNKFNQPTVTGGKILLPSYDGTVLVLG